MLLLGYRYAVVGLSPVRELPNTVAEGRRHIHIFHPQIVIIEGVLRRVSEFSHNAAPAVGGWVSHATSCFLPA